MRGASVAYGRAAIDGSGKFEAQRSPQRVKQLAVCGVFAGIGGIEEGFRRAGHESIMLCEADASANKVLKSRFPKATFATDVRELKGLPACDVLTAGFPCQDLSQVGRRLGIDGPQSGLIERILSLLKASQKPPAWLILENVPFMLKLERGRAIRAITMAIEAMGWSWAYRIVDTRAFGLPQRRRRVILVASPYFDPRPVLLAQDQGLPEHASRGNHACGFYWTEGNTGLGWADDAIPPLKGGSGLHIPSPPAIWFPRRRSMRIPSIRDAERLQGFDVDWTAAATEDHLGDRKRWRLVGNAVTVDVAEWIAGRLGTTDRYDSKPDEELDSDGPWPDAAWGSQGVRVRAKVSDWPVKRPYAHLASFLRYPTAPLTSRATGGFLSRLEASCLKYDPAFAKDLRYHLKHEGNATTRSSIRLNKKADARDSKSRQQRRTATTL